MKQHILVYLHPSRNFPLILWGGNERRLLQHINAFLVLEFSGYHWICCFVPSASIAFPIGHMNGSNSLTKVGIKFFVFLIFFNQSEQYHLLNFVLFTLQYLTCPSSSMHSPVLLSRRIHLWQRWTAQYWWSILSTAIVVCLHSWQLPALPVKTCNVHTREQALFSYIYRFCCSWNSFCQGMGLLGGNSMRK